MFYEPHEVDPRTIHLNSDIPLREQLEGAAHLAKETARKFKKYVLVNYDEEKKQLHVKSQEPDMFEKSFYLCPRAADAVYETLSGPRPIPSILADPDGNVVVSKPSLCNGCKWNLERQLKGHCHGKKFERLDV